MVLSFQLKFFEALPSLNLSVYFLVDCCIRRGLLHFDLLHYFGFLFGLERDKIIDWDRCQVNTTRFGVR